MTDNIAREAAKASPEISSSVQLKIETDWQCASLQAARNPKAGSESSDRSSLDCLGNFSLTDTTLAFNARTPVGHDSLGSSSDIILCSQPAPPRKPSWEVKPQPYKPSHAEDPRYGPPVNGPNPNGRPVNEQTHPDPRHRHQHHEYPEPIIPSAVKPHPDRQIPLFEPETDSRNDRILSPEVGQALVDAIHAGQHDQKSPSESNFHNAVDKLKALGQKSETELEELGRDLGKPNGKVEPLFSRANAAIADGLGEFRLEQGSRINPSTHFMHILQGHNYDFGGEATIFLRLAGDSLAKAQGYAQDNKDKVVEGQPLDDAYIKQLGNLHTGVESKLSLVYGAHDLPGIYKEIKDLIRVSSQDWQQGLLRLDKDFMAELNAPRDKCDNRFLAKSARDLALGYLAEAELLSSNVCTLSPPPSKEDLARLAKIFYKTANTYLAIAEKKDHAAPDNQAIQDISTKLGKDRGWLENK